MPQVLERVSEQVLERMPEQVLAKMPEQDLEGTSEQETAPPTRNRIRITRKMCDALADNGLLTGRYELIDGEVISKMGQKPVHATVIRRLNALLIRIFGERFVGVQLPIELEGTDRETNEPEPDLVVSVGDADDYSLRHPLPHEVVLLVEVADTSLAFDLKVKSLLYAKAGIADYWVVDAKGRRLVVHRKPSGEGYLEIFAYSEEESLSPLARPDASVRVSDLMPPEIETE